MYLGEDCKFVTAELHNDTYSGEEKKKNTENDKNMLIIERMERNETG